MRQCEARLLGGAARGLCTARNCTHGLNEAPRNESQQGLPSYFSFSTIDEGQSTSDHRDSFDHCMIRS